MNVRLRTLELLAIPVIVAVALLVHGPIAQFDDYHHFADMRARLGIPNFSDTVSNLPFLLVGLAGLLGGRARGDRPAWRCVFAGALAVAAGSTYYHLAPDDARLVWDRLPIALTFMAFLVAMVDEHFDADAGWGALLPALALGAAGVLYWKETGDLRLYLWTQIVPLLAIPGVLLLYRPRFTDRGAYWAVFACYVAAKLAELWDFPIYRLSCGVVSGHTLKHLIAAAALAILAWMLARRRPVPA